MWIVDYKYILLLLYNRAIMKSFLKKIAREFSGNFVGCLCKFPVNSRAISWRNDFIIVRLSHFRNPAINLRIAELRLMRNPPLNSLLTNLRVFFPSPLDPVYILDIIQRDLNLFLILWEHQVTSCVISLVLNLTPSIT